jgi:hypothetical protein
MSKTNSKHVLTATLLFCFLIVIAFSCSENAGDETPQLRTSAVGETSSKGASLSTGDTGVAIQSIGAKIPNETAKRWIANHDKKNPDGIKYYLFGKETFQRLLSQPNAVGIRLCNAYDDSGNPVIVMVAVDGKNSLLDGALQEGFDDASQKCPPVCTPEDTN